MIIVRLMGGLGNQMFQYAAGRRLADLHNTKLKIDLSWLINYQNPDAPAVREYELDCFVLPESFAKKHDLARIHAAPHHFRRRLYQKLVNPIYPIVESETADFTPEALKATDNTYLEGFWQSEKYFADAAELIRADFAFKLPPSGKNKNIIKEIQATNSVSLHVRRGDYAFNKEMNKFHGLMGLDYYKAAVAAISKKVKNPHFFVISDDPAWCKKHIKLQAPVTFVDHNKKGYEDLRLMSLCQHNIIANSSFSWWGAWLNNNPEKIVYAPKQWFANSKMSVKDRLPATWIKL